MCLKGNFPAALKAPAENLKPLEISVTFLGLNVKSTRLTHALIASTLFEMYLNWNML